MHKSPTELAQNAQWRMATALRLGATPDAGPRSTCALRKGNDGDMWEQSLAEHPFHPFGCQYGGAWTRPHRAVECTLRKLIEQAGGYADVERHVPELHDWVQKNNEAAPLGRGLLVPGCPAAALGGRQRTMPVCRTLQRKCVETKGGYICWRSGENEALWNGSASVGLRDFWKTGRRGHLVVGCFGDNGSGKWTVQPARCRMMENPAGTSAADCTSRHKLASAGF